MVHRVSVFITLYITVALTLAASGTDTVPADTAAKRPNLIQRVINYFNESNKPKPDSRFDFSVIGGPHYSTDSKFGLGLVLAGTYNTGRMDSLDTTPSNVGLYADATTAAHFSVALRGTTFTPQDRWRLNYDIDFSAVKTDYWGIGYEQCSDDANETAYRYLAVRSNLNFCRQLLPGFYAGVAVNFDYIDARSISDMRLFEGLPRRTLNWGPGVTLQYDSRDNITNAHRGVYLRLDQYFDPSWLGNKYPFYVNELTACYYRPLWRGAHLATQIHWRLTWGDTQWGVMSSLGGSRNMRGYFKERYRDKSEADVCVELRQHVWRRSGVVAWVGAATIFDQVRDIQWRRILPNFGVGYRWEFKKNMNVRLDLGFGRGQKGFIFNINEAF